MNKEDNIDSNEGSTNDDDESVTSTTEMEKGPPTGGASGDDTHEPVTESFVNLSPNLNQIQEKERNEHDLRAYIAEREGVSATVPYPTDGEFVNDYNIPNLLPKTFPHLFPYGVGDFTNRNRPTAVTEADGAKHYIKYCVSMKKQYIN